MDPEKVGFVHFTCEGKAGRKSLCWLLFQLQPLMSKELWQGTVGMGSYLTEAPVGSSPIHPAPDWGILIWSSCVASPHHGLRGHTMQFNPNLREVKGGCCDTASMPWELDLLQHSLSDCQRLGACYNVIKENELRRWEVLRVCQVPWLIQNRRGQNASVILETVLVELWSEHSFSTFWSSDHWCQGSIAFSPLQKALKLSLSSREDVRKFPLPSFSLVEHFLSSSRKTTSCDQTIADHQLTTTANILGGCCSVWQLFMPPLCPAESIKVPSPVCRAQLEGLPVPWTSPWQWSCLRAAMSALRACVRVGFVLPLCLTLVCSPWGISLYHAVQECPN